MTIIDLTEQKTFLWYLHHTPSYLVPYASSFVNFAIEELVCIKDLADCEWPQKEWCKRRGDKTKI